MRFTAVAAAAVAFAAGAQAAVVDRQISIPIDITCILDGNTIDILKRWDEPSSTPCETPTTTISSSVSWTPTGTTSYTTATITSTAVPYGGYCPCDSNANKKRFIEERQISVPVEVTCSLDGNTVTVGTTLVNVVGDLLGDVLGDVGDLLGDLGL